MDEIESGTYRLFIIRDRSIRNMKCARVAKQIQLDPAKETALDELTNLNSFIRSRTDRRSLVSVAMQILNNEAWVCLFSSHFAVTLSVDLNVTTREKVCIYLYPKYIYNTLRNSYKKIIIEFFKKLKKFLYQL